MQLSRTDQNPSEDLFLGKTFKEAIHEWLLQHHGEFSPVDYPGYGQTIEDLTSEMCEDSGGLDEI